MISCGEIDSVAISYYPREDKGVRRAVEVFVLVEVVNRPPGRFALPPHHQVGKFIISNLEVIHAVAENQLRDPHLTAVNVFFV